MLQFHGGMGDPVYAAGSYYLSGRRHPSRAVELAAEQELTKLYDYPDPTWTKKDMTGLWRAVITMTRLLEFDPKSKRDITLRRKAAPRRDTTKKRWSYVVEDLETGSMWFQSTMKTAKTLAKAESVASGHPVAVLAMDKKENTSYPQGAYYGRAWRGGAYTYTPRGRR